ncbi:response regulator transcription factor [Salmonella enterica]|nr:response regulator transcription factor [Salmonella enterica subsp. enterica serovar Richmond]ECG5982252.1 response regulator transcription factor [Salmonella enterica subsp. enterica serovar Newport]EEB3416003.1 response regulator transcription factor [Salmonella enterica]
MRLIIIGEDYPHCHHVMMSLKNFGNIVDYFTGLRCVTTSLSTVNYCAVILINASKELFKKVLEVKRKAGIAIIALQKDVTLEERNYLYNAGVDDFIDYTVDILELQTRIKVAVRRRNFITEQSLIHRDIVFNLLSREVYHAGEPIYLTSTETSLLEVFFLNKGRLLPKRYLEDKLFPWGKYINSNVIEVHISSLRKKLGRDYIVTFYGQGYRLG